MSQQSLLSQSGGSGCDSTVNLGNLQSVGPSNQNFSSMNSSQSVSPQHSSQTHQTSQSSSQSSKTHQSSTTGSSIDLLQFLSKARLQDLVKEVDPTEQLDEEVEEMLLQLADDFVETTVNAACLIAKHRHANTVEVKDVQLHLGTIFQDANFSDDVITVSRLARLSSAIQMEFFRGRQTSMLKAKLSQGNENIAILTFPSIVLKFLTPYRNELEHVDSWLWHGRGTPLQTGDGHGSA